MRLTFPWRPKLSEVTKDPAASLQTISLEQKEDITSRVEDSGKGSQYHYAVPSFNFSFDDWCEKALELFSLSTCNTAETQQLTDTE